MQNRVNEEKKIKKNKRFATNKNLMTEYNDSIFKHIYYFAIVRLFLVCAGNLFVFFQFWLLM